MVQCTVLNDVSKFRDYLNGSVPAPSPVSNFNLSRL